MPAASSVAVFSRPTVAFVAFCAFAGNGAARRLAPARLMKGRRLMSGRDAGVGGQQVDVAARAFGRAREDAAARSQNADLMCDVERASGVLLDQDDGESFLAVELLQGA